MLGAFTAIPKEPKFYNPEIVKEFDKHYTKRKSG